MLRMWRVASVIVAVAGVVFVSPAARADAIADANTAIANCDVLAWTQAADQFRKNLPAGANIYDRGFPRYPEPCGDSGVKIVISGGTVNAATDKTSKGAGSNGTGDIVAQNQVHNAIFGGTAGVGAEISFFDLVSLLVTGQTQGEIYRSRYASEAENAYAANFPIRPPRDPRSSQSRWDWGFDANAYFFMGGDQKFTGIAGGPFGTATGADTFKVSNNVLFTAGAWLNIPVIPVWAWSVTGGFAELNQTVKYTCVTFCAVAPATGSFTASTDHWTPGAYVGTRLTTPLAIPGLPSSTIGIDYKHVFLESYTATLGTVATRQVTSKIASDMDMVTLRLAVSLR